MTHHTLPHFTGRIQSGQSETKQAKQARLDIETQRYRRRIDIDRHNDERELKAQIREVWDE